MEQKSQECTNSFFCRNMEKAPLTTVAGTVAGTVAVADSVPFKMDKKFCSCMLFLKQNDRARTLWGWVGLSTALLMLRPE